MTDPELFIAVPTTEAGARSLVALLGELLPGLATTHERGIYLLEGLRRRARADLEELDQTKQRARIERERDNRPTIKEKRG